jgi:hypothetical protein
LAPFEFDIIRSVGRRMKMKMKEMTAEELRSLVEFWVEEKLIEILGDPEERLTLRPEVKRSLRKSLARLKGGERGKPAAEVARKLGLRW